MNNGAVSSSKSNFPLIYFVYYFPSGEESEKVYGSDTDLDFNPTAEEYGSVDEAQVADST